MQLVDYVHVYGTCMMIIYVFRSHVICIWYPVCEPLGPCMLTLLQGLRVTWSRGSQHACMYINCMHACIEKVMNEHDSETPVLDSAIQQLMVSDTHLEHLLSCNNFWTKMERAVDGRFQEPRTHESLHRKVSGISLVWTFPVPLCAPKVRYR